MNKWQVCPYEEHVGECDENQYYNELACQCFLIVNCEIECSENQELHPTEACFCAESEKIRDDFYPDWVNNDYIRIAKD